MINVLGKVGLEETYLHIRKAKYYKPTVTIIQNGEKLEAVSLKSGVSWEYPVSPLLLSTVLEALATAIRSEEETKQIQIGRKEVKLSLIEDNVIIHRKFQKL